MFNWFKKTSPVTRLDIHIIKNPTTHSFPAVLVANDRRIPQLFNAAGLRRMAKALELAALKLDTFNEVLVK